MAKGLLICYRNKTTKQHDEFFNVLSRRIRPDNAVANQPYIYQDDHLVTYIYNPTATVRTSGASFLLGVAERSLENVFEPLLVKPDGTYALFRIDSEHVEILSDYTASRSIWYYMRDDCFVASTSQRMIVAFLGDFEPNMRAASWMLSSGTMGPGETWDKRINHLPGNSSILLKRKKWEFIIDKGPSFNFQEIHRSKSAHKELLGKAVKTAITSLDVGNSNWTLALSGGMDSRSLLYHLKASPGLNTVTWGLSTSFEKSDSDATLARRLSSMAHLPHVYAETDHKVVDLSEILNRFLVAGEGRVDHLSGYMDGLKLWSQLSASGRGIIRGYDAFGRKPPVSNTYQARRASGLIMTMDYANPMVPSAYYLSESDLPDHLKRRPDETLIHWRDRLWLESRTPFVTAALDDIKVAYVEIVNPLLCKRVVEIVLSLPEHLRTNKALFEEIVSEMFPDIPFATRDSVQMVDDILSLESSKAFLVNNLIYAMDKGILPSEFLKDLITYMDRGTARHSLFRWLVVHTKASLPMFMENYLRSKVREQPMNIRRTALRSIIVINMHELLYEDAKQGKAALQMESKTMH